MLNAQLRDISADIDRKGLSSLKSFLGIWRSVKMANRYYIDYENTGSSGLNGVEFLGSKDEVVVFCNKNLKSVSIDTRTSACIRVCVVDVGKKDALDFQLVASLFMNRKKKHSYYIISNDTGYDFAINIARKNKVKNVHRYATIQQAVRFSAGEDCVKIKHKKIKKEKLYVYIKNIYPDLDAALYYTLKTFLKKTNDKHQFDLALRDEFGDETGRDLYRMFKEHFEELQKLKSK